MITNHHLLVSRLVLGILTCLYPMLSLAGMKLQDRLDRPRFLSRSSTSSPQGISSLPALFFIAKSADYYIENKTKSVQIWCRQPSMSADSKIVCPLISMTEVLPEPLSFAISAPTLLDLTQNSKKDESRFWQFQMMVDGKQVGVWNQTTNLFPKGKDIDAQFRKNGVQVQVFKISMDQYELIFSRERNSFLETLAIRFDAVSKLP